MLEILFPVVAILVLCFLARLGCYILNLDRENVGTGAKSKKLRTLICIGSGGHTAEMLRILKNIDKDHYTPRLYVMASNDDTSEVKVTSFEEKSKEYSITKIFRSREVGQSYLTSVWTTIRATLSSVRPVVTFKPDVILCNGPGTCIPICLVALAMNLFFMSDCKIVFVESICRVRTLSLSGQILKYIANVFVVQWEPLMTESKRFKYFGRLS